MQTLEALSRTINSIEDLQSVVRTMKALAMVNLRQYEKARLSLTDYNHTIELGLQALLQHRHFSDSPLAQIPLATSQPKRSAVGVIIFGSDHGLCGQFNEQIVNYTFQELRQLQIPLENCQWLAIGARLIPYLDQQPIQDQFALPSSLSGIPQLLQNLLTAIEKWCFSPMKHAPIRQILLFYNRAISSSAYKPSNLSLLPLDRQWLRELEERPSQSNSIPMISGDWESLFSAVIRQYLFASLYQSTVESFASENAARLSAMQTAEKNIEERLLDLHGDYRQQRQNSITEELLDIVSGFEALKKF